MKDDSVTGEIHKLIDEKIASGVIVNVDWVAAEILDLKCHIEGEDAPFYRVCTFKEVCRMAKRAIGKYDVSDTTSEQLVLPGFKHLCKAYPITREDIIVLVPVNMCTDEELMGRAGQLDEMARGCRAHASEIREYLLKRNASVAA